MNSAFVDSVTRLTEQVDGPVFRPGDTGYDTERIGFQLALPHHPAVIVGATGPADVRAAVDFAVAHGMPVAVQSTGHGVAAAADGGLLVTTARMTGVQVDPAARIARVEAGARWDQVIGVAAAHGLAPLSGSLPGVGVVGYTLGGGIGLLARLHGYAADHVRTVEMVTADGRPLTVTADSEPELFWALRGGQGNFGVVTALTFDLFPVSHLYGGTLYFDASEFGAVVTAWRGWTTTVPDEMTSATALVPFTFPDVAAVPAPLRGHQVAQVQIAYAGGEAAGKPVVDQLRSALPEPLLDTVRELPYTESGSAFSEPDTPHGYRAANALVTTLDTPAFVPFLESVEPGRERIPCVVGIRHLGGALSRPPLADNAISHREAGYAIGVLSQLKSVDLEITRATHQRLLAPWAEWTIGRALNFSYGEITPDEIRDAYEADSYDRLVAVKTAVDPTNVFRLNHNIPPTR